MIDARNRGLSPDLTFDEFKKLACRKPDLNGDWIYMVTQSKLFNELKNPYPKFELSHNETRYFKSFHDAENYIKTHTEHVYCSRILQIPFGDKGVSGYSNHGAEWLYDQNGKLLDYTITKGFGAATERLFFGRPESRQRFKAGDIVEVISGVDVRLAVLCDPVPSIEHCWVIYSNRDEETGGFFYILDFSDDSAIVVDGPSYYDHDHVSTLHLLEPRFPIPEDLKAEMLTWNQRCIDEDESHWRMPYEQYRAEHRREEGEKIGEFYQLNLHIHFDDYIKPHLHINDYYGLKVSLCMDKAEYYDHDDYTGRLTNNEIESLGHYLTEIDQGKTRWWYMIRQWNELAESPDLEIPLDLPIPDYLSLSK